MSGWFRAASVLCGELSPMTHDPVDYTLDCACYMI
jgi:hypothetical protein